MFTTGSKFYFGVSAAAFAAALLYGLTTGGHVWGVLSLGWKESVGDHYGYAVLLALAVVAFLIGSVVVAFRDADADAVAAAAGTDVVPEVAPPRRLSYWPLISAFAVGLGIVGLATNPALFVIGGILAAICAVEWTISAWADRATGDPSTNQALRDRLLRPVELPLLSAVGIGAVVFAISRLLLAVSKEEAVIVGGVASAVILAVAFMLSSRPQLGRPIMVAVMALGGIGVLAGGIVGAALGERDFELHHEEEHEGDDEHNEEGEGGEGESGTSDDGEPSTTEGEG